MDYIKVTINFANYSSDMADVLMALLADKGFEGFVELTSGFEAYIQAPVFKENMLNKESFPNFIPSFTYIIETIPDQNWNEIWEKNYFNPIVIENQCVVRSPFHIDYPKVKYQIVIEPKMSFGTGHHETTAMMIEMILETDIQGKNVLDMGCGTGILGILASMKGAKNVTGIDIDAHCVENCIENCRLNNIPNMNILLGDASLLTSDKNFDIIFANINRNILLEDIPKYQKVLNNKGLLIISGFYIDDLEAINTIALNSNILQKRIKNNNSWVAIMYE